MRWALNRKEGKLLLTMLGVVGQRDEDWKAGVGGDVGEDQARN